MPELPRVLIDTSASPAITGATWTPANSAAFQVALDGAALGDLIVLTAGTVYAGHFTLPNKTSGSGWITIRSSAYASLPAMGTRVGPANVGNMPTVQTTDSTPAIQSADGAHHYYFLGIEVTIASGVAVNNLGVFALHADTQNSAAATPHHVTVDRCYIHGRTTGDVTRPVLMNSATTAFVDSYISEGHIVGADAQALTCWNGPGPFKIVNNYLSGAGENVIFGGADPGITNLVPSDIEFRQNLVSKPLSWKTDDPSYAGIHWTVKNLFELKNAQRVWIDRNILENNWPDAQTGYGILFTPRNQDSGALWSVVQDVTYTNNILRNSHSGIQILGEDDDWPGLPSLPMHRVLLRNNLMTGLHASDGKAFELARGPAELTIDHTTAFPGHSFLVLTGTPYCVNLVFTNNIVAHGTYGAVGDATGVGNPSLTVFAPDVQWLDNLLIDNEFGSPYPPSTFQVATMNDVGFVNWATGNYRLTSGSAYHLAGTDGLDLGCNLDALPAG